MKYYRLTALLPAIALLLSLAACEIGADNPTGAPSQEATASVSPTQEPSAGPVGTPDPSGGEQPDIRLAVLSGPTGIGAAKLLSDADNNPGALRAGYNAQIYTDNRELVAKLTTGEIDVATMASNVAVKFYHQTHGVKIIAAGTLGVLYILEGGGGDAVHRVEDLRGKTVWAAGQGANPEYILRYLLQQSELEIGKDVTVEFADAGEIQAGLKTGSIRYAMLPVPAATVAIARGEGQVRAAIDVTEAWNELQSGCQPVMTAVVARTEFVEEHPELVDAFLADYEESIHYVNNNLDAAAELAANYKLTPDPAIARQAIPQCHLVFLSGYDMVDALSGYYLTLYGVDRDSVGSLPSDSIYYIP